MRFALRVIKSIFLIRLKNREATVILNEIKPFLMKIPRYNESIEEMLKEGN